MKKTSFSPLNDFWLNFMNVSINILVLVQDFNPIRVPRYWEDLENFQFKPRCVRRGIIIAGTRMIICNVNGCGGKNLVW